MTGVFPIGVDVDAIQREAVGLAGLRCLPAHDRADCSGGSS